MRNILNKLNSLTLAGVVFAATERDISIEPPPGFEKLSQISLPGIVSTLIQLILVVAALVAFVFLIIGGIKWITSGGDKEQTAKAQSTITAALVGLVIVFATWAIIKLLEAFFGITIFGQLKIPQVTR